MLAVACGSLSRHYQGIFSEMLCSVYEFMTCDVVNIVKLFITANPNMGWVYVLQVTTLH